MTKKIFCRSSNLILSSRCTSIEAVILRKIVVQFNFKAWSQLIYE